MKATIVNEEHAFIPVNIILTFESQKELDFFGKLFNSTDFTAAVKEYAGRDISLYAIFRNAGADISDTGEVMRIIKSHIR